MRDNAVVESIVARDPAGLADAYDDYGDLVYAYCRSVLGSPREAADATQATFVSAVTNARRLGDASVLRAWLLALARGQCAYSRRNFLGPGTGAGPVPADTGALSMAAGSQADRAVLRDAINGLSPAERDVLTLLWHGLDVDETALVLGRPRGDVYSLLSRARDQLEMSVTALLVCHYGRRDCRLLSDLAGDWDGSITERLRESAARHISHCAVCSACRDRELRPSLVLSLTAGALLRGAETARTMTRPAPPWLRNRLLWLVTTDDPQAEAECRAMDRRLDPFGKTGFPGVGGGARAWLARPGRTRLAIGLGCGVAAAAAAVALIAVPGRPPSQAQTSAAAGTALRIGDVSPNAPVSASPRGSARPSPSPHRTLRPTPSSPVTMTPPATASTPAAPVPAAPAGIAQGTLSVSPSSVSAGIGFGGSITLTAHGGPVTWSVAVPAAAAGLVGVSPESGTLNAGQSVTLSVSQLTGNNFLTTLTFSPGSRTVAVQVGLG